VPTTPTAAAPTHYINPYDGGAAITEAHCHALALKAGYRVSREALRQTASPAQVNRRPESVS
jgi:hypothetical protein